MNDFGTCENCGAEDQELDENGLCPDCSAQGHTERGPDMGDEEESA